MKAPLLTSALILAAAAFAPAGHAQELCRADPELGHQIAEQGNRALAAIHAQTREAVKHLSPAPPSDYAYSLVTLKRERGQTPFSRKGVDS